jgi:CRP-like cAMP-binding protein
MANAFIDNLRRYTDLTPVDLGLLESACATVRAHPAGHDLVLEGDPPGPIFIILEGWACRYKLLPWGTRQIVAFMMPGDFCDLHAGIPDEMDHSIGTLTRARVAMIARPDMEHLIENRPALTRAFWRVQLVNESVSRSWIVSMGRRNAAERVAHLMCEFYVRAHNVGLTSGDHCEMPLTQIVLADALGMTAVHINRVLRQLRLAGIMTVGDGTLTITDAQKLARAAGFDDHYLHRRLKRAA